MTTTKQKQKQQTNKQKQSYIQRKPHQAIREFFSRNFAG